MQQSQSSSFEEDLPPLDLDLPTSPLTQTPEEKIAALEEELRLEKAKSLYQITSLQLSHQHRNLDYNFLILAYTKTVKDFVESDYLRSVLMRELHEDLLDKQQELEDLKNETNEEFDSMEQELAEKENEIDEMGIEITNNQRTIDSYENHFLSLTQKNKELTQKVTELEQKLTPKSTDTQKEKEPKSTSFKKRKFEAHYTTFRPKPRDKTPTLTVTTDTAKPEGSMRTVRWSSR